MLILLREEQACLLESLAVEAAGVLEDLTERVNADMAGEYLFAPSLDGLDIIAIRKREEVVDEFALNLLVV